MHQYLQKLALAAAALLLLGACSDDDPGSDDPSPSGNPSSTVAPSGTPTVDPSTDPTLPTEPPVPDAMAKPNKAGAKAFVHYYWDVVNYAQATGDVKTLKALNLSGCEQCIGIINGIRKLYRNDGWAEGGERTVRAIVAIRSMTSSVGKVHAVTHEVAVNAQTVHRGGAATPTKFGKAVNAYTFQVLHLPKGWRITYWETPA